MTMKTMMIFLLLLLFFVRLVSAPESVDVVDLVRAWASSLNTRLAGIEARLNDLDQVLVAELKEFVEKQVDKIVAVLKPSLWTKAGAVLVVLTWTGVMTRLANYWGHMIVDIKKEHARAEALTPPRKTPWFGRLLVGIDTRLAKFREDKEDWSGRALRAEARIENGRRIARRIAYRVLAPPPAPRTPSPPPAPTRPPPPPPPPPTTPPHPHHHHHLLIGHRPVLN
jgi:hypothetical protein